jgi:hypothetical protein
MNYCALTFKNFNGNILKHIHLNYKGINTDNVYSFGTPQHMVTSVHIFGILSGQIITDFFLHAAKYRKSDITIVKHSVNCVTEQCSSIP